MLQIVQGGFKVTDAVRISEVAQGPVLFDLRQGVALLTHTSPDPPVDPMLGVGQLQGITSYPTGAVGLPPAVLLALGKVAPKSTKPSSWMTLPTSFINSTGFFSNALAKWAGWLRG